MAFKEIPIDAAAELVKNGQFEYVDVDDAQHVRYLGNSGSIAKNVFGSWTAPDLPETEDAPHSRPVEVSTEESAIDVMNATDELAGIPVPDGQPSPTDQREEQIESRPVMDFTSIPFMLTSDMRNTLSDYGYTQDEINAMTPQEAHAAIKGGPVT